MAEGAFGRNGRASFEAFRQSKSPGFSRRYTETSPKSQYIFKQDTTHPTLMSQSYQAQGSQQNSKRYQSQDLKKVSDHFFTKRAKIEKYRKKQTYKVNNRSCILNNQFLDKLNNDVSALMSSADFNETSLINKSDLRLLQIDEGDDTYVKESRTAKSYHRKSAPKIDSIANYKRMSQNTSYVPAPDQSRNRRPCMSVPKISRQDIPRPQ
jgi:hypothetical protein